MAIACFRLFTRPPLPAFPERNVPCFFRRMALFTDFPAAFPYLGIVASCMNIQNAIATTALTRCVSACKLLPESMYVHTSSALTPFPTRCTALQTERASIKVMTRRSLAVDCRGRQNARRVHVKNKNNFAAQGVRKYICTVPAPKAPPGPGFTFFARSLWP